MVNGKPARPRSRRRSNSGSWKPARASGYFPKVLPGFIRSRCKRWVRRAARGWQGGRRRQVAFVVADFSRQVSKGTIEERIVDLHHDKRALADSILAEGEASALPSTDDLVALIRGD